jgi:hypothetical protein
MSHTVNVEIIAGAPPAVKMFANNVTEHLLFARTPTCGRNDSLWNAFKHQFRTCLDLSSENEEQRLHGVLHNKPRKIGDSLYGHEVAFQNALLAYHLISPIAISDADDVHLELHASVVQEDTRAPTIGDFVDFISGLRNTSALVQWRNSFTHPGSSKHVYL